MFKLPLKQYCVISIGIILALGLGYTIGWHAKPEKTYASTDTPLRNVNDKYQFIKPLLACDLNGPSSSPELDTLAEKLTKMIDQEKSDNNIAQASVYVSELDAGKWTGVNTKEVYSPASLMKVPVLMAYFKIAEKNPDILKTKITVTADMLAPSEQFIPPQKTVEIGQTYTVEDLLTYMIVYSDNNALAVLSNAQNLKENNQTFYDILDDLGVAAKADSPYTISVRKYSRFFRTLYNSTYLSDEYSEKALELLNQVDFKDGILSTLPAGVKSTQKFGESASTDSSGNVVHELHDCGNVYLPNMPYNVCIMTRGNDLAKLTKAIQDISTQIYAFESSQIK